MTTKVGEPTEENTEQSFPILDETLVLDNTNIQVRVHLPQENDAQGMIDRLKFAREILPTYRVDINHEDVQRILKHRGVNIDNDRPGQRDKRILKSTIAGVQHHHGDMLLTLAMEVQTTVYLSDAFQFTVKNGIKLPYLRQEIRREIEKQHGEGELGEFMDEFFAKINVLPDPLLPTPAFRDHTLPDEQRIALVSALLHFFPVFKRQYEDLSIQFYKEIFAMRQDIVTEAQESVETDENGFRPDGLGGILEGQVQRPGDNDTGVE